MSPLDALIARAQRNITYAYIVLFAGAIAALLFLPRPLDDSTKTLLITLLGVLGTLVTMQTQFWYARNRTGGVPDPATTTTTTETPNAITTTTVQPAPAAPPADADGLRDPER
jgi:hypothetical protein